MGQPWPMQKHKLYMPLKFLPNRRILANTNASWKSFRTFAVRKDKFSNFIGKSLNLATYSKDVTTPLQSGNKCLQMKAMTRSS